MSEGVPTLKKVRQRRCHPTTPLGEIRVKARLTSLHCSLSYVSAIKCYLNRLSLWFLFFRLFSHGRIADWKNNFQNTYSNVRYIILVLRTWYISFSIQLEAHEDNWKHMYKNKQKPELEPEPEPCCENGELRSRSHTHENQELRSWSRRHVHEKKSSGAGAVSFFRRLRSPGSWKYNWEQVEAQSSNRLRRFESEPSEPLIDFLAFLVQKLWSKINKLINYLIN